MMFNEKYETYLSLYTDFSNKYFKDFETNPPLLGESMRYSLLGSGKRIRPVLMLAAAEILNVPAEEVLPFALALEMIHTYSLIHDDLPAMDNDDYRRGKPSNHKVYGEGHAILAGDGLLNTAYSICLEQCLKGEKHVYASKFLCECAGVSGMIAGQSADLLYSKKTDDEITEEDLWYINEHKTGKLLLAPLAIASILADNKSYFELEKFGKYLGVLFQVTDDILDEVGSFDELGKTIGKDKDENKLTSVRLYGLDGAKIRADLYADKCYAVLDAINGDVTFFKQLVTYIRERKN